jgi:DNA ligase (NAD+)
MSLAVDLRDRFRGCVVGLAVGDALGHPTEFISSVARIQAKYGARGIVDFAAAGSHPPGTFTDDTQMTIAVARALAQKGHASLDELMTLLGREFVAWSTHPTNNRAPGGTCLAGCRHLAQGASWKAAGVRGSKGCGAAMRAAPVGLFFANDEDALLRVSAAQSVLTHSHPTGIASSVAAAAPVAWLARGNGLDGIIDFTRWMVERLDEAMLIELGAIPEDARTIGNREQLERLDRLEAVLDTDDDDVCALLGGAWVGEEAVATALWCFLKAGGDFAESVRRGATSSGDSDSIACIAGSFAGTLQGYAALPPRLRDRVERHDDLVVLADELSAALAADRPTLPACVDFFDADRASRTSRGAAVDSEDGDDGSDGDDGEDASDDDPLGLGDELAGAADSDSDDSDDSGDSGGDDDDDDRGASSLRVDGLRIDEMDVAALEAAITKHNRLYWVEARPEISDVAFDALCRRLTQAQPDSEVLAHLGPTPDAARAVVHTSPMRSLDKCYEEEELFGWTKSFDGDVVAMPKIDGLACSLHYDDDGWLMLAATRGDGEVGENVTANVKVISSVPRRIAAGPVEVRGEVFISLERFHALKAATDVVDGQPKNPRNLAAGALRHKDPNKSKAVGLSFLAYDLRGSSATTHQQKLALLAGLGFAPIPQAVAPKHLVKVAVDALATRRTELPYETDGVVIVVDDLAQHERLGATSHHPRSAIAWKFQGEEGVSVLRGVQWQVARTGTITPVAVVDPVELSGVTVTRATLHHRGFLDKLGLTIGAKLAMVRRGGVIPHVERVITAGESPVAIPATCPSCGATVVVEGDFLLCSAPSLCVAATIGRLLHWGKSADIIGLGESVAEQLVEAGLAKTPADLYRLTPAALAALPRLGPTLADKLLAEIEKTRRLPLDVLLRGLGIDGLGKTVARALAERFLTLERVRTASLAELVAIKGLGEVSAEAIRTGLARQAALIDDLVQHITPEAEATTSAQGPLSGLSFVFTGALTIDRKSAEARARSLGALTPSGVSRSLTHLVVGGDRTAPSSKQKAAERHNADGAAIVILDEAGFDALLRAHEGPSPAASSLPAPASSSLSSSLSSSAPTSSSSTEPAASTLDPAGVDAAAAAAAPEASPAATPQKRQLTLF